VEIVFAPLIEYQNTFINDILIYKLRKGLILLFIYHLMNYKIPVTIKSDNLRRPIISKLSGKLFVAGRQCVVSGFKFVSF